MNKRVHSYIVNMEIIYHYQYIFVVTYLKHGLKLPSSLGKKQKTFIEV